MKKSELHSPITMTYLKTYSTRLYVLCCAPTNVRSNCTPPLLRPSRMVEVETGAQAHANAMPPNRLVTLLQQAVAFQIQSGRYHPKVGVMRGS